MNKQEFLHNISKLSFVKSIQEEESQLFFSILSKSGYEFIIRLFNDDYYMRNEEADYLGIFWDFVKYELNIDDEIKKLRENIQYAKKYSILESAKDFESLRELLTEALSFLENQESQNRRIAESQNRRIAESQNRRIAVTVRGVL